MAIPASLAPVQSMGADIADALPRVEMIYHEGCSWFNVKEILIIQGGKKENYANVWLSRSAVNMANQPELYGKVKSELAADIQRRDVEIKENELEWKCCKEERLSEQFEFRKNKKQRPDDNGM
jgi:hypothetical protein